MVPYQVDFCLQNGLGRSLKTYKRSCYCYIAERLSSQDFRATEVPERSEKDIDNAGTVDLLSPFLAVAYTGSYGLVSTVRTGGSSASSCNHCHHKGCDHITLLREWCELNGLNEEIVSHVLGVNEDETYTAMSSHKIPYPLSSELKTKYDLLESGLLQFPIHLVPPFQQGTWNFFSRQLDISFQSSFLCPVSGAELSKMICDGTMLGFCKDLISHIPSPSHPQKSTSPSIAGTNHQDRVLLKSP